MNNQHIVVIDSQFRFPVSAARITEAGKTLAQVRAMSGEEYADWCREVGMDGFRGPVGSQGCIDYCDELVAAGADVWEL